MRLPTVLVAALAGLSLAGCATIRGSQEAPAAFIASAKLVSFDQALKAYNQPIDDNTSRMGMSREDYRNYVIGLYENDIENRYQSFKQQLNSADRGSALAGDLLLLGLTGATALAGASAADELATITAVATGASAAIDKRLFFDRTMTAVIAAMDARRARIQAEIAARRQLPDDQYRLDAAIRDLRQLIAAGNIFDAIEHITADATADKQAAEARLKTITDGCSTATVQTAQLNHEFMTLLTQNKAESAGRIAVAAKLLGAKPADGQELRPADVAMAFDAKFCGDDEAKAQFVELFKQGISAKAGDGDGDD